MELQENSQEYSYRPNNVTSSHNDGKNIHDISNPTVGIYFRSQIFQGVILGWAASISVLILAIVSGMWGQRKDYNVIWDLRVGFFLTAVTVITRVTSIVAGFMVPAILAGMFFLNKILTLKGSGMMISQLIEAFMSRGLLCTVSALSACFNSGQIRKLAIVIASVLMWQYATSAADLYLHITATGGSIQLPGSIIPSTRSLDIATDCPINSFERTCITRKGGTYYTGKALKVYGNMSETLKIWNSDGGIYLLQSPPSEQAYAYSGSGVFLQPFCEPISSICNLKARYGIRTNYTCPEALWSASSSSKSIETAIDVDVNVTSTTLQREITPAGVNIIYTASNPTHAIIALRYYSKEEYMTYDSEFVTDGEGGFSILLHCQIISSKIEYIVTLGLLKASPLGNLTSSQLYTLGVASRQSSMVQRAMNDIEGVSYEGNSTLFANVFAQQWSKATIASFSGIVQENGEGYFYVLEVSKDQTIAPLLAVLVYAIVIIFPLLIFSCISLYSLGDRSSYVQINWILAEFICTPQRLIYQALIKEHYAEDACLKSLAVQKRSLRNIELSIKVEEGHLVFQNQKEA